jgi:hypothetical protein
MNLTAEVVDPAFAEVNDAQVLAQVKAFRKTFEVPLQWSVTRDGEYRHLRARRSRVMKCARRPSARRVSRSSSDRA